MSNNHFDYIIIGNGMAGLQLALALSNDSFFNSKSIALIDKSNKTTNDRTWSFWEKGIGKWDDIVYKSWSKAYFNTYEKQLELELNDYKYKSIRSIDFYNFAKEKLSERSNFTLIIDDIISTKENDVTLVEGTKHSYSSNHIFDSRIPETYFKDTKYTKIHQHFKGWIIETETDTFNPDSFVMMDYRIKHNNDSTFTYVLPLTNKKALIEFTFFTPYTVEDELYDVYIKKYLKDILKIDTYSIKETETGNIPMTDYPFYKHHTKQITKIGTAAGWVKGSTGYAFKHTEKNVLKILSNIKYGYLPSKNLISKKYLFYDKIFLDVLKNENEKGEWIFHQFYAKNSVETMFKFLDEESSLFEDVSIMLSLFSTSFIKAFFRTL